MKRKYKIPYIALLLISMLMEPIFAFADDPESAEGRYLNIATMESRPISVDRLLYTAFQGINYDAAFTPFSLETGCDLADDGEMDGVIVSSFEADQEYPNLHKVPVPLETVYLYAFLREGSHLTITNWSDLSGLTVGLYMQRPYMASQLPSDVQTVEKETVAQVINGLAQGEYDVAILPHRSYETIKAQGGITRAGILGELTNYLYLSNENEHLVPLITDTLNQMFFDGRADKILNDDIFAISQKKTVIHILSSNTEIAREEQFGAILRERVANESSLEWYTVSLDSRRSSRVSNRLEGIASLLRQDCVSRDIAAIVVSGDVAMEFLKDRYELYFRNVPVLYYGVYDEDNMVMQGYESYFTGIVENIEAYETVKTALELFPNTKNLYVVNDFSAEGSLYRREIESQLASFAAQINIEYNGNTDCASLMSRIKELPKNSLLLVGSYFLDADGQYFGLSEMGRLLKQNCSVPIFSLYSTTLEYNAVGGKCLDYEKSGEAIAGLLSGLLRGTKVESLPGAGSAINSRWVFEKTKLDDYRIKESSLPLSAQIINDNLSIRRPLFVYILIILLIVSFAVVTCVGIVFYQQRKHKKRLQSDVTIKMAKERLELTVDMAPVLYIMCIDGVVTDANEKAKKSIGLKVGDDILEVCDCGPLLEQKVLKNEIITLKFTDGRLHRCLFNKTEVTYESQKMSAFWAIDIEENELKKDELKVSLDKLNLFEYEFELEDVLNSVLLAVSPLLDGKAVQLMLNTDLDLPRFVIGDRARLWQILQKMLLNSTKQTENGKIVLSVFMDQQNSNKSTAALTFVIEDTSIGLEAEQLETIFQSNEFGMAVSKQLCELMGGQMRVESRLGVGTAVHISISFKRSPYKETEMQAVQNPALVGKNILAVDNDFLSLDIMERLLENSGVSYATAHSGRQAINMILKRRDKGEFFDLVLLGSSMDGLSSLETAKQIRLFMSRAPKILMITAYQKLLLKELLENSGIDDMITKPFSPSYFISRLCEALASGPDAENVQEVFTMYKDVRVLLCEDQLLNQEVAVDMFAQFGLETTVVGNGQECLDILNSGRTFDMIFMDLQMPVMDGYEATRNIRSHSEFDHIPIISMTADEMAEVIDKCLTMGMNGHIAKPIEFSDLQKIFRRWLPKSKVAGETASVEQPANEGLARFGGKKDRYEKALLAFTEFLPDEWPNFDEALKDQEKTAREVHSLKGVAGNLGENDIYQCAIEFENSLRASQPNEELYNRLAATCDLVKKKILEQIKITEELPLSSGTAEEFKKLLGALKEAMQDYDPQGSSAVITSLRQKTWPSSNEDKMNQIYMFARKYEFDTALDILSKVMEDINE